MIIETQQTPEKDVLNFFTPTPILKSGVAEFVDAKSIRKFPLAEKIFDIGEVISIFITSDMLSITKEENASWDDLKPQIMAEIMDYLSIGEKPANTSNISSCGEDNTIEEIKALLNARIRPAVKQDGGDIIFKEFKDGIVYVEMIGNCSSCPYALVTLKEGVEKVLTSYISAVKEVRKYEKENND